MWREDIFTARYYMNCSKGSLIDCANVMKNLFWDEKENKPNNVHQRQMKIANKENSGAKNNWKLTINYLIHQTKEGQMVKENCWFLRQRSLLSEILPLNPLTWDRNFNNILSSEKSCRCEDKLMDHSLKRTESKCFTDLHHRV